MSGLDGMIPGGQTETHTHPASGLQVILKAIKGLTHPSLLENPYHFQVAPLEEFGWDAAANWNDYVTVRGGSYSRPGGAALRQVPMQSLVVDWNPTWAVYAGGNHHQPLDEGKPAPDPLQLDLKQTPRAGRPEVRLASVATKRDKMQMSRLLKTLE